MYFKLEAMLNLRFVEPALSYEKGATILLQLTRAKEKTPQSYLKLISKEPSLGNTFSTVISGHARKK